MLQVFSTGSTRERRLLGFNANPEAGADKGNDLQKQLDGMKDPMEEFDGRKNKGDVKKSSIQEDLKQLGDSEDVSTKTEKRNEAKAMLDQLKAGEPMAMENGRSTDAAQPAPEQRTADANPEDMPKRQEAAKQRMEDAMAKLEQDLENAKTPEERQDAIRKADTELTNNRKTLDKKDVDEYEQAIADARDEAPQAPETESAQQPVTLSSTLGS